MQLPGKTAIVAGDRQGWAAAHRQGAAPDRRLGGSRRSNRVQAGGCAV